MKAGASSLACGAGAVLEVACVLDDMIVLRWGRSVYCVDEVASRFGRYARIYEHEALLS